MHLEFDTCVKGDVLFYHETPKRKSDRALLSTLCITYSRYDRKQDQTNEKIQPPLKMPYIHDCRSNTAALALTVESRKKTKYNYRC